MVNIGLIFNKLPDCFSIYTSLIRVWDFYLLSILPYIWYCQSFSVLLLKGVCMVISLKLFLLQIYWHIMYGKICMCAKYIILLRNQLYYIIKWTHFQCTVERVLINVWSHETTTVEISDISITPRSFPILLSLVSSHPVPQGQG